MGTHPIFESDFDCLTDCVVGVKSKTIGMGFFGDIFRSLGFGKKPVAKIVCVGLDNSGKTTLLNQFKSDKTRTDAADIVPTVGFTCEKFTAVGLELTVWDFSGQGRYRNMWELYYKDAQAVIFVLDSADRLRMAVARDELESILGHEDINKNNALFLFFANKMDLADATTAAEASHLLELPELLKGKAYHIQASNAVTGEGVQEGLTWLAQKLKERKPLK